MAARGSLTIIFPEQVQSVNVSSISSSSSITTSGESVTTTTEDGQTYSVAFALVDGYKINGADFTPSVNGGIVDSFTDSTVDITAGAAGIDGTLTITVQQSESTTVKTVSSDNLARFKQKCDETYAAIGNIPTVSTELVNLGTLSTSGTLTTDQVTQIGTTTIGVTARASVNGVTRFYERVNISGTTATLVSADDDALHVLTVNMSTRAYTLSDVALGGGGIEDNAVIENAPMELPSATADSADFVQYPAGTLNFKAKNFQGNASGYTRLATYDEIPDVPEIPTPTTTNNGQLLGVQNGVYSMVDAPEPVDVQNVEVIDASQSGNTSAYTYGYIIDIGTVTNGMTTPENVYDLAFADNCVGVKFIFEGNTYVATRCGTNSTTSTFVYMYPTGMSPMPPFTGINTIIVLIAQSSITVNDSSATIPSAVHLYRHNIILSVTGSNTATCRFEIINTISTQYTGTVIGNAIGYSVIPAVGTCTINQTDWFLVNGVGFANPTFFIYYVDTTATGTVKSITTASFTYNDVVTQII